MLQDPLSQVLILLAAAVVVVTIARRLGLPAILGYLVVGMLLGTHAVGIFVASDTTNLLAELGVVFLLFTLGLEFSWPRMIAMRREVFGLGMLQVFLTSGAFAAIGMLFGVSAVHAIVLGGAVAMSSTAIILHQLTDQAELNRTHGRLAFSILLFQDIAFVPLLALASALARGGGVFSLATSVSAVIGGVFSIGVVWAAGRWLLRPLFYEIAHSRLRELFTLAVLLVALASAWVSHLAGLSMALGAFLAGMMLAETEYRHQIEAVIRPFRDILLGLFFISVGTLLDVGLLWQEFALISAVLAGLLVVKWLCASLATRAYEKSRFKAVRTGVVVSIGGEFGVAILTILLQSRAADQEVLQPVLVAIVLSMVLSPLILRNNKRIARFVLREKGPPGTALSRENEAADAVARREHVVLCGFGRVGQNIARVLEAQNFEYIALDLDPVRIRAARQAGDPVMFGDSADEDVLAKAGLATASAVIITFANPAVSIGILQSIRRLRADVPVLVRTQDDSRLGDLKSAGATEVVPETFEASLMLVSHVLMQLHVPPARVLRTVGEIRGNRYAALRSIFRRDDARPIDETHAFREELRSIVLPPGGWAVGRTLAEVRARGAEVAFTGIRRQGILGREPEEGTVLREGDIVVVYGQPEAIEHAEALLLAG
ncbi:MAG: Glutathione-regulated potassium-efflux system protein KefC [Steroidobacteraceae bacterium]|nr:Glutathione-regulated potassium-efflux system protein KefC [Steroidobacteraceae bacterium]